jgi:hypothetical protein
MAKKELPCALTREMCNRDLKSVRFFKQKRCIFVLSLCSILQKKSLFEQKLSDTEAISAVQDTASTDSVPEPVAP